MYMVSLEAARVNAKLTQKEAADKLKKSLSTIRNWEKGSTIPDAIEFKELCALYNVPSEHIFLEKK